MRLPGRAFPYGYVFISLLVLGVGYLKAIDPRLADIAHQEDHLWESLTAAFYLLAAPALLACAARRPPWFPRTLYLLAAAGCLFVAGEEISWGQRLLGFATPDFFAGFNVQGETTFHNYRPAYQFLDSFTMHKALTLFFCLAVLAAYSNGKDRLFGLPLPSVPLVFGFLLALGYNYGGAFGVIYSSGAHTLLLLLFLYALLARQGQLLWLALAAIVNLEAALYVNYDLASEIAGSTQESTELLLSAGLLAYSLELLRHAYNRRPEATEAAKPLEGGGQRRAAARFSVIGWNAGTLAQPAWLVAAAFIIVAGFSLAALGYLKDRMETAQIAAAWQLAADGAAGEPFPPSPTGLEVYRIGNRLLYAGDAESCAGWRRHPPVFLHLIPANPADLSESRREYGFDDQGFSLGRRRTLRRDDGRCAAVVPLPDYPMAQIRTGQRLPVAGLPWESRLVVNSAYQEAYDAATANPPALRSEFDVYLTGHAVTYIKEPCAAADTAGMFILHPYPANPDDLPEWRQGQEFDNLDFQFDLRGARFDGKCVAAAPLPGYPIDRLRVGQWLPDENRQLWQGEIPVGR